MEEIAHNIGKLDMDKSTWKTYRFDQIASMVSERVEPGETDLEIYVGLEHLDPESLHIKRFGTPADVKGTKLRVYPGDVIFGRRRAYQRKAAIAEFDGICSAHAMVLRANPKVIEPKLFPFFLHSDTFMHRAVDISVGSLSPTINWKTLRKQTFLLPPKDQQARIAELLWAGDGVVTGEIHLLEQLEAIKTVVFERFLLGEEGHAQKSPLGKVSDKWTIAKVDDIASKEKYSCVGGPFGSNLTSKYYVENEGVPVIRGINLSTDGEKFIEEGFVFVSEQKANQLHRNLAYPGDIIVTQRGTLGQVGLIPHDTKYPRFVVSQSQMKLTVDASQADPEYIYLFLCSRKARAYLDKVTIATGVPHINLEIFREFPIIMPTLKEQKEIVMKIEKVVQSIKTVIENIKHLRELQKSLINQIF